MPEAAEYEENEEDREVDVDVDVDEELSGQPEGRFLFGIDDISAAALILIMADEVEVD